MNGSQKIRKFERFLFKGISEQPESVWERNDNANITTRLTGKSFSLPYSNESNSEFVVLGTITYDYEKQIQIYTPSIDSDYKIDLEEDSNSSNQDTNSK